MADLPPPYQDPDNQVSSYPDVVGKPRQWRVVTSLYQKKRFMAIVPISENASGDEPSSYRISSNQSLQFQARGFRPDDPNGNCFEGPSSLPGGRQSLVANIELSTQNASFGDIAFLEPGKDQNIFVDAQDLSESSTSTKSLISQDIRAYLTYHESSQKTALPVSWKIEPRYLYDEVPLSEPDQNPATQEKKHSFWKKDKTTSKNKPKSPKPDSALERQMAMLNAVYSLRDDEGNTYATFESDFFSGSSTSLPKEFKVVDATHRSWGTMSIGDPALKFLRSEVSLLEKWSDAKLEQLILISFVSCMEINLRLQGGSEGKAFVEAMKASAVGGSVFGAEGLGGMANKLTGGFGMGGIMSG